MHDRARQVKDCSGLSDGQVSRPHEIVDCHASDGTA
jgi:hypothetical protein